jgi:hypothetical protein
MRKGSNPCFGYELSAPSEQACAWRENDAHSLPWKYK